MSEQNNMTHHSIHKTYLEGKQQQQQQQHKNNRRMNKLRRQNLESQHSVQ